MNTEKIKEDSLLDGKFLISASSMKMKAEDIAMGYKQLWTVERVFRDMKNILELRPVYHRLEDRIRCHVLICWLAMILIRTAENATGMTWLHIERIMSRITAGAVEFNKCTAWLCSDLPEEAEGIFKELDILPPSNILSIKKNL